MGNNFFEQPILNSPYEYPAKHWELQSGQPTSKVVNARRRAELITPIPKPKSRSKKSQQQEMAYDEAKDISSDEQKYERTAQAINEVRRRVDA